MRDHQENDDQKSRVADTQYAAPLATAPTNEPVPYVVCELADETRLRRYLWLSHGHPFHALYGDDGEMQCQACAPFGTFDYKRTSMRLLLNTLEKVGEARMVAALRGNREAEALDAGSVVSE